MRGARQLWASNGAPLSSGLWWRALLLRRLSLARRKPRRPAKERLKEQRDEFVVKHKGWPPREPRFDHVMQTEKNHRFVLAMTALLQREPGMRIRRDFLGRHWTPDLGILNNTTAHIARELKRYPSVFEFAKDPDGFSWCRFTVPALTMVEEEVRLRREYQTEGVGKLRKMLMMSANRRILLEKFNHVKEEFGLPDDYKATWIHAHRDFFSVKEEEVTEEVAVTTATAMPRTYLELREWDPSLAITAMERREVEQLRKLKPTNDHEESLEQEEELASKAEEEKMAGGEKEGEDNDAGPYIRMFFKQGYTPNKHTLGLVERFQSAHYISPYKNTPDLILPYRSPETEKFTVAVLHEVLSLTLEKRMMVEHLGQFRNDFRFPGKLLRVLLRHQGVFYVLEKQGMPVVFLKEAYRGSKLIDKCPLILWKERFLEFAEQKGLSFSKGDGKKEKREEGSIVSDEEGNEARN